MTPSDALEGPAARFLQSHKLFLPKGDGPISYTSSNGGVVRKLNFEQQQQFQASLARTYQQYAFSWNEVLVPDAANGVAIDFDVGHVADDEKTLEEAKLMTLIVWHLCQIMLSEGGTQPVHVVCCLSWPSYKYANGKAKPSQLSMFGRPCVLLDDMLQSDTLEEAEQAAQTHAAEQTEEEKDRDLAAHRAYSEAAIARGFRGSAERSDSGADGDFKVGLHLYAFRELQLAADGTPDKVRKIFVSRADLAMLNAVAHHQLQTHFGDRVTGNCWSDVIDGTIKSLRIPGANKVDACPYCKDKERKRLWCEQCDNTGKLDIGRPYLPFCIVNAQGKLDSSDLPVRLAEQRFATVLEIARIAHFAEHDPEPTPLRVPAVWLGDPNNVKYYSVTGANGKQRKACIPRRAIKSHGGVKEPKVELSERTHGEAFAAMNAWLQNSEFWGGTDVRVSKIFFTSMDVNSWTAVVIPKLAGKGNPVCAQKGSPHKSATIWFRLTAAELGTRHRLQQYCYAAGCQQKPAWCPDGQAVLEAFSSALAKFKVVAEPKSRAVPPDEASFEACFSQSQSQSQSKSQGKAKEAAEDEAPAPAKKQRKSSGKPRMLSFLSKCKV